MPVRSRRGSRATSGMVWVAALAVLTTLVTGCGHQAHPRVPAARSTADTGALVTVSVSACGAGWSKATSGTVRLRLRETDTRPGEMRLVDDSGAVYADVEPLGPGTTRDLALRLDPGTYTVQCLMEDEAPVTGAPVRVTGTRVAGAARGVAPADQATLVAPTLAYQRWVSSRLPRLLRCVEDLSATLDRGDLAGARAAWLRAHRVWGTLGAAYGAFGERGEEVDGLPYGLPAGVHDPAWHGFHRIEHGLWADHVDTRALAGQAARLVRDVREVQSSFDAAQVDPGELTLRAHEIVEDTVQQTLEGRDDFGSHSALQTVRANLAGAQVVLGLLAQPLRDRHVDVDAIEQTMAEVDSTAAVVRTTGPTGPTGPTAVGGWPRLERERLAAVVAELAEQLAPVATVLEPRRTS